MNISLRAELDKFVHDTIQSGRFHSEEEAVNEAVQLLREREQAEIRLESLLQEADDSGPATEMTPEDWVGIENEGMKRRRARKSA